MAKDMRKVVAVPTLRPRLADNWDVLCSKLLGRASRSAAEAEVVADARRLGFDVSSHLDNAWSHARNLRGSLKVVDVSGWAFDAAGVKVN
jgi:hypothetical protein